MVIAKLFWQESCDFTRNEKSSGLMCPCCFSGESCLAGTAGWSQVPSPAPPNYFWRNPKRNQIEAIRPIKALSEDIHGMALAEEDV